MQNQHYVSATLTLYLIKRLSAKITPPLLMFNASISFSILYKSVIALYNLYTELYVGIHMCFVN